MVAAIQLPVQNIVCSASILSKKSNHSNGVEPFGQDGGPFRQNGG
jgi:hypothetical protein